MLDVDLNVELEHLKLDLDVDNFLQLNLHIQLIHLLQHLIHMLVEVEVVNVDRDVQLELDLHLRLMNLLLIMFIIHWLQDLNLHDLCLDPLSILDLQLWNGLMFIINLHNLISNEPLMFIYHLQLESNLHSILELLIIHLHLLPDSNLLIYDFCEVRTFLDKLKCTFQLCQRIPVLDLNLRG